MVRVRIRGRGVVRIRNRIQGNCRKIKEDGEKLGRLGRENLC